MTGPISKILSQPTLSVEDCIELTRMGATYDTSDNCLVMPDGTRVPPIKLIKFVKSGAGKTLIKHSVDQIKKEHGIASMNEPAPHPVSHRAASGAEMMMNIPRHIIQQVPELREQLFDSPSNCIRLVLSEYSEVFDLHNLGDMFCRGKLFSQPLCIDSSFARVLLKRHVLRSMCDGESGRHLREAYSGEVYGIRMSLAQINQGLVAIGDELLAGVSQKRVIEKACRTINQAHCGVILARVLRALSAGGWRRGLSLAGVGRLVDFVPTTVTKKGLIGMLDLGTVTPSNNMLMTPVSKERDLDSVDTLVRQHYNDIAVVSDVIYYLSTGHRLDTPGPGPLNLPRGQQIELILGCTRFSLATLISGISIGLWRGACILYGGQEHLAPLPTFLAAILALVITNKARPDPTKAGGDWLLEFVQAKLMGLPEPSDSAARCYGRLTAVLRNVLSNTGNIELDTGTSFLDTMLHTSAIYRGTITMLLALASIPNSLADNGNMCCFIHICDAVADQFHKASERSGTPEHGERLRQTIRRLAPVNEFRALLRNQPAMATANRRVNEWGVQGGVALPMNVAAPDQSKPATFTGRFVPENYARLVVDTVGMPENTKTFARMLLERGTIQYEHFLTLLH
jgi:phage tail protein X